MLNGRKTIATIVFDCMAYYQHQLVKNMSHYCEEKGYNLLVFSAFTVYGTKEKNSIGEFNIINLIPFEQLDAFILCHDTFGSDEVTDNVRKLLKERCTCPIISVRSRADDCYNILVDDEDAIESIIKHLYEQHNYERIAFMSGPKSHPDSIFRLNKYHETMEKLNLPHPEEYVFEGDFWRTKAVLAAEYYSTMENRPQAILCANDYMALSLCKNFILRGYNIPHDFAVCGYDNIVESLTNVPPLTTCKVEIDKLAYLTIDTIDCLLNDRPVDKDRYVYVKVELRNSCGCQTISMHDISISHMQQIDLHEKLQNQAIHNSFTSIALENLISVEDIGDYLQLDNSPDNAKDFHLCLGKGEDGPLPQTRQVEGFAEQSQSVYSLLDLSPIITSSFPTKDLLPPEAVRDEPMTLYFFPVHYLQYNFGYVAATSAERAYPNKLSHSWLAAIGTTLENRRIRNKNDALVNKLNILYVQDSLTNLYNRRGFEQFSTEQLEQSRKDGVSSMILGLDMDNLKYINDIFGHAHGDIALRTIADAMRSACSDEEVCARIGGDEFQVFGMNYDNKMAKEFEKKVQDYLQNFNKTSNLPYMVNASIGYTISSPTSTRSLEYYIKKSDHMLYKNKRERKARYGNLSQREQ